MIQPPEVWVPDAFTVNNDGINEVWGTFPLFVKNYQMKVFDRWGEIVYENYNVKPATGKEIAPENGWDGTFNGQSLPATDYWFVVEYNENDVAGKRFRAHFSLKR